MKRIILFLAVILFGVVLCAQNSAYGKQIYKDYGTFRMMTDGGNIISVSAFATIENDENVNHEAVEVQQVKKYNKDNVQLLSAKLTEYHYELYMVSKSVFDSDTTSTWLYGTRIFVNGIDVLEKQFSDGFVVSIKTEPTLIYTYHSKNKDLEFEITFEKSVYEPRTRK